MNNQEGRFFGCIQPLKSLFIGLRCRAKISVISTLIKIISKLKEDKNANISIKKISDRYGVDMLKHFDNPNEWIDLVALKHTSGDRRRMAHKLLEDYRNQKLGKIALEVPI